MLGAEVVLVHVRAVVLEVHAHSSLDDRVGEHALLPLGPRAAERRRVRALPLVDERLVRLLVDRDVVRVEDRLARSIRGRALAAADLSAPSGTWAPARPSLSRGGCSGSAQRTSRPFHTPAPFRPQSHAPVFQSSWLMADGLPRATPRTAAGERVARARAAALRAGGSHTLSVSSRRSCRLTGTATCYGRRGVFDVSAHAGANHTLEKLRASPCVRARARYALAGPAGRSARRGRNRRVPRVLRWRAAAGTSSPSSAVTRRMPARACRGGARDRASTRRRLGPSTTARLPRAHPAAVGALSPRVTREGRHVRWARRCLSSAFGLLFHRRGADQDPARHGQADAQLDFRSKGAGRRAPPRS